MWLEGWNFRFYTIPPLGNREVYWRLNCPMVNELMLIQLRFAQQTKRLEFWRLSDNWTFQSSWGGESRECTKFWHPLPYLALCIFSIWFTWILGNILYNRWVMKCFLQFCKLFWQINKTKGEGQENLWFTAGWSEVLSDNLLFVTGNKKWGTFLWDWALSCGVWSYRLDIVFKCRRTHSW